jgi:hypothetical protein
MYECISRYSSYIQLEPINMLTLFTLFYCLALYFEGDECRKIPRIRLHFHLGINSGILNPLSVLHPVVPARFQGLKTVLIVEVPYRAIIEKELGFYKGKRMEAGSCKRGRAIDLWRMNRSMGALLKAFSIIQNEAGLEALTGVGTRTTILSKLQRYDKCSTLETCNKIQGWSKLLLIQNFLQ